MTRQKLFLIRAEIGRSGVERERVIRLPVDKYDSITPNGMKSLRQRFSDGATGINGDIKSALCLESFTNGRDLVNAIKQYSQ